MNTKRIISLILSAILSTAAFCSCAENVDNTSSTDTTSLQKENSAVSETSQEESSEVPVFDEESAEISIPEPSEPEVEIIPEDTVVSFVACADNLVHPSLYYDAIERAAAVNGTKPDYSDLHNAVYDFLPIYDNIAQQIAQADIAYINQESLIGGDSKSISAYPRFNTPAAMGQAVVDLGFDVVNVAHNHMLDSGNTDFLEYCNEFFESRNVDVLGYYPNEESTEEITIIEREGIKVAFLTYTYGTNGIKVSSDSEFVIPYFEEELIKKQVALAKSSADVVIVSAHWGHEYTYKPNSMQKEYANLFCELGVDVVIGMHPHCIQPVEWLTSENGNKTLIVYSIGTMVSGIRKGMSALAGIISLNIIKDGETGEISIESPLFIPTVLHYTRGKSIAENDTASRNFVVYYLSDYTQELADEHAILRVEKRDGVTTLEGGSFSLETLWQTVNKYIDAEFLESTEQ